MSYLYHVVSVYYTPISETCEVKKKHSIKKIGQNITRTAIESAANIAYIIFHRV